MIASKLQTIRLLNGIRLIHLERINGYNKALLLLQADTEAELKNVNLGLLLSNFVRDSIFISSSLENIVLIEGGKMPYGTRVDQKLYNIIRKLRPMFEAMDNNSILSCSEICENTLQEAYDIVLHEQGLAPDPKSILLQQQAELKKAQQLVSALSAELLPAEEAPGKAVLVDLYQTRPYETPGVMMGG